MKNKHWIAGIMLGAGLALSLSAAPATSPPVTVVDGLDLSPWLIDSLHLDLRKVAVRDVFADMERTFTRTEERRGFKSLSYVKFFLRDSKIPCFVERFSLARFDEFKQLKKGERITVTGRLERVGKGIDLWCNPKFVLRVEGIQKGWVEKEGISILEAVTQAKPSACREVSPEDLAAVSEEYRESFVRFQDKFSLISTYYTNFEKDLNLSNATAIKFRGELCPLPCYLMKSADNAKLVSRLKTGDKITVTAKVLIRPIPDDQIVLLAVRSIEEGWQDRNP